MMPSSFFSSALVLWTAAMMLLIVFDLHRMFQLGKRSAWYERPVLWFAVSGISFGLGLALLVRGSLSDPLYWFLIFAPLMLFTLSLFGGLILAMRPVYKKISLNAEIRLGQQDEFRLVPVAKSQPIENQALLMMIWGVLLLSLFALMDLISFEEHFTSVQFNLGAMLLLLTLSLLLLSRGLIASRLNRRLNQRRIML
ncbi:MAG: hypothetical protein ACRDHZ_13890, partial [Ktedonobacteraceae bacterium]